MQELQTLSDSTGISVSDLEAMIAGGVDPNQFVVRQQAFPEFINGAQYKFRIVEAEVKAAAKGKNAGQDSLKLVCKAVDGEGQVVDKVRAWIYIPFPFDTATFSWSNPKGREIAQGDLENLLAATGAQKYQNFGQKVNDGKKNHFFDFDGKELVGKEISAAKAKALANRLIGMKALQEDPTPMNGIEFYATYSVEENVQDPTRPWKKWKYITTTPSTKGNLILEASAMQVVPGKVKDESDDNIDF